MGGSLGVNLRLINNTPFPITTYVTDIDPHDWENRIGPQNAFHKDQIPPFTIVESHEEIKRSCGSAPIKLHIKFSGMSNKLEFCRDMKDFETFQEIAANDDKFECFYLKQKRGENIHCFHYFYLTQKINTKRWMKAITNEQSLSMLTIPGTHNSVASRSHYNETFFGHCSVLCQDMDLEEQLECGIRFFDIGARHIENGLTIHHGEAYLNFNLLNVLDVCAEFLRRNPSEAIVMRLKKEHTEESVSQDFEETFRLTAKRYSHILYNSDDIPILGNVRGRIVLIRDFEASSSLGIPWDNNNSNISIQDNNETTSISNKWDSIEQQLEKAGNDHSKRLYVNVTSYAVRHASLRVGLDGAAANGAMVSNSAGETSIESETNGINELLQFFLVNNPKPPTRYGIVIMDFPTKLLIKMLISKNSFIY